MKNKKQVNEELDIKGLAIVFSVLLIIVVIIYLLTLGAKKIGLFDEGYYKPEISNPVISYDNILAGTIFNRNEDEYYVLISDFDSKTSTYINSLLNLYNKKSDKITLYSVNLGNDMNKTIIGEESNTNAQNVEELSINGDTLIKIENGVNIGYFEGIDNIKTELGV